MTAPLSKPAVPTLGLLLTRDAVFSYFTRQQQGMKNYGFDLCGASGAARGSAGR
jgi:hypothetical protein